MEATSPLLVIVGSVNTDLVVHTPHFPVPGETCLGGGFQVFPGGKGANQAVAAARLGARVALVGKVGRDEFGQQALANLQQEGLATTHVSQHAEAASGVALITINAEGQNTIVVAPGANHELLPADIDEAMALLEEATLLVVQLEIPLLTVVYLVEWARQRNKRVVLNPAPAQPLPEAMYRDLFLLTPNETEAELLTGIPVRDADSAQVAAQVLRERGVQNVVVTLGAQGAFVHTATYTGLVPAPRVQAVDTTAAGDVFTGALAVALTHGWDWEQAAEFACQAAAVAVTRLGAQVSAPYRHEVMPVPTGK
ncbi:ribokinase [Hymenobacter sp. GOD-10R]|uniref:ribokinase n=1 Tax=Hymenobacter sp. GOD-10R TaxID=3093922 RepID=UPI002D7801FD|nr:ribokinase [Hymenobacter sp. GOD-10R]WRQ26119.1 ribokinase [Hymenobacter sp. GOD-10R]